MPHHDRRSISRLGGAIFVTMALTACAPKPPAQASSTVASAAALIPGQEEGDFTIRDVRFASGETIPELRLHYTTLGKLGVAHLRLLLGTSMGGMHTWLWAEKYPDMMEAAVPIACEPTRILGRNLLWRRMIVEATKGDPKYDNGEYTAQPKGFLAMMPLFYMMTDNPAHLQQTIPSIDEATSFIHPENGFGDRSAPLDANNVVYALDASRDYDPERDLAKIKTKVLAINFADDELNAVSLGNLARLVPRVAGARFVIVPASERTRGHMTQLLASVWQEHLNAFLHELK